MDHVRTLHCARLFDGRELLRNVRLRWRDGRITAVEHDTRAVPSEPATAAELLVAPGLLDLQVNGGGGLMFNDRPDAQGAAHIARAHALRGSTGILPTLITDTRERVMQAGRAVREALAAQHPGILGLHLEGPFINPARQGIHRAELITPLTDEDVQNLVDTAAAGPTLLTLAPETVAPGVVRRLTDAGVIVFAGHTQASATDIERAIQDEGLQGVTHLFNAMSQLGPRDAGVVGTALLRPDLWASLILDGHHVGRAAFDVVWRMRGNARLLLVSDAMATAGTPLTRFELQGRTIEVRDGRCADGAGTLAGAAICLADAVRLAVTHYHMPLADALHCATAAPAQLLGLSRQRGHLAPGTRADLAVFDAGMHVTAVLQGGAWLRPLSGVPETPDA